MSQSPESHSFTVIKHIKSSPADKEPVCVVKLKTAPTDPFQAKIEISDNHDRIFTRFPLNETIEVTFRNPQTRLDTEQPSS